MWFSVIFEERRIEHNLTSIGKNPVAEISLLYEVDCHDSFTDTGTAAAVGTGTAGGSFTIPVPVRLPVQQ